MSKRLYVITRSFDGVPFEYLSGYEATGKTLAHIRWTKKPEQAMTFLKPNAEAMAFQVTIEFPVYIGELTLRRHKPVRKK